MSFSSNFCLNFCDYLNKRAHIFTHLFTTRLKYFILILTICTILCPFTINLRISTHSPTVEVRILMLKL